MTLSLEDIFHKQYSALCNYAASIVKDEDIAEDIVQGLFIQLYERKKWDDIKYLESFLLRSVKYKCIDHLRKAETSRIIDLKDLHELESGSIEDITEEDILPLFHYYAAKLPPKTREVFLLSRESKLSNKEIAEELNISLKTVEAQMSRALKKMKAYLKEYSFLLGFFS